MFDMSFSILQVLAISAIMSTATIFIFRRMMIENIVSDVFDNLIEGGYLKSKTNSDGEVELIKIED